MLPRIKIKLLNGQLGIVGDSPDGLFALVCAAVAVAETFKLDTSYSVHSLDDLKKLGLHRKTIHAYLSMSQTSTTKSQKVQRLLYLAWTKQRHSPSFAIKKAVLLKT